MSTDYADPRNDADLHQLMAIAVVSGQRGVIANTLPIYEAWSGVYPRDALGAVGRGMALIAAGKMREGYVLIEDAARGAETRTEQARDVLETLKRDIRELVD